MQVLFAKNDRAGVAQAAHNFGVFGRNPVFEECAGGGGADAGGIENIFEPDGDAVERAAVITAEDFLLSAGGPVNRGVSEDGDERVKLRVDRFRCAPGNRG